MTTKAIGNYERSVWVATGDGSFSLRYSKWKYTVVGDMETPAMSSSDSSEDIHAKFVFAGEVRPV